MKATTRTSLCALALLGAFLPASLAWAQDADLAAQVEAAHQRYEEVVAAGDWAALGTLMTEDAIYMPLIGGMAEGKEAIQSQHQQMGLQAIEVQSSRTERLDDNLVLDAGTFTATLAEQMGGGTLQGEYVTVYEQSETGLLARSLAAFPVRQLPGAPAQP